MKSSIVVDYTMMCAALCRINLDSLPPTCSLGGNTSWLPSSKLTDSKYKYKDSKFTDSGWIQKTQIVAAVYPNDIGNVSLITTRQSELCEFAILGFFGGNLLAETCW